MLNTLRMKLSILRNMGYCQNRQALIIFGVPSLYSLVQFALLPNCIVLFLNHTKQWCGDVTELYYRREKNVTFGLLFLLATLHECYILFSPGNELLGKKENRLICAKLVAPLWWTVDVPLLAEGICVTSYHYLNIANENIIPEIL